MYKIEERIFLMLKTICMSVVPSNNIWNANIKNYKLNILIITKNNVISADRQLF